MFANYLKIAFRNLFRNKFYTFLNISGLSIGIVCAIFVLIYKDNEDSYDKHNKKWDRIYRLESNYNIKGKDDKFALTSIPLGPALKEEFPEVENYVRFFMIPGGEIEFKYGDKYLKNDKTLLADSTIFDVFTLNMAKGDSKNALNEPNTAIVSETFAKRMFGNENPIGKVLVTGKGTSFQAEFKITGVFKDLPENSHLKYDVLASLATIAKIMGESNFNSTRSNMFWNVSVYTYLLLKPHTSMSAIYAKFDKFYDKYMKELGEQINSSFKLMSTPLAENHFNNTLQWDQQTGNYSNVVILSLVGIFLLVIACINYMNMATARSANRSKEVAIRKVVGAQKTSLIRQFLLESVAIAFIALVIALVLVELLLPTFRAITQKEYLQFSLTDNPMMFVNILILTVIVGLIAGSYPALYLSSFRPVVILKGKMGQGAKSGILRKLLVILQFTISIALITGTLFINDQLDYLRNKDLGFNKENILVMRITDTSLYKSHDAFKEELLKNDKIIQAATSTSVPGKNYGKVVFRVEDEGDLREETINFAFIDWDYLDMMGIRIVRGRNFDKEMGTDKTDAFIINEAAAKAYGWGENAIGKRIQFGIELDGSARRDGRVIGVVKDFHYASLHNKVAPLVFMVSERPLGNMSIKIKGGNIDKTLNYIESKRKEFVSTESPFDYFFLDNEIAKYYTEEQNIGRIFAIFSVICIFIACLGLLGLSAFITEQRTKEIGIRKVLGATVSGIVYLLSTDFLKLVLISFLIAVPVTWWAFTWWQNEKFAYKVPLDIMNFVYAGLAAALIAFITISWQSMRAALSNPVYSLRYE